MIKKVFPALAVLMAGTVPVTAVYAVDNTKIGYGQGTAVDEKNRPTDALSFNDRYCDYDAYAISNDEKRIIITFDQGYENGYTQPSLEILCKLCEIFNISIDSLMDFDNINPDKNRVLKRSNIRAIKPIKVRKDRSIEIKQVVVVEVDKVLDNLFEEMIKANKVSINKKDLTKEQKEFALKIIKNTNQLLSELYA